MAFQPNAFQPNAFQEAENVFDARGTVGAVVVGPRYAASANVVVRDSVAADVTWPPDD